ncbi:DUF3226 domain-containing protein [Edaphobacter acidisoli]|uniref:DUF3226 domain-containing protein n=1 Tax=Edaphobacter acidisoli TaxID=2040573 RepID=UPI0027E42050|nr:DUF3226 domain-containing protein [Edaphobacter acidisoli]
MLGEGTRDKKFLEELCAARGIAGHVMSEVESNANFGKYIQAISAQTNFLHTCKAILIVSDSDESQPDSFKFIKKQLNDIGYPSPAYPLEIAKKKDMPSVAVVMLPYPVVNGITEGCLETVLIPAMESANCAQAACVDQMLACVNVAAWPKKSSRDKAKVRCLISAVWSDDPMKGLQWCYGSNMGLIPLGHAAFDGLADILSNFPAWAASDLKTWAEWKAKNP